MQALAFQRLHNALHAFSLRSARTRTLQVLLVSDKRADSLRRLRDMARGGKLPLGWGGPVLRVADELVLPLQEVG